MQATPKTCLHCSKPLRGRSDKKFCDDYCRNNYNNQLKSAPHNYVRNINNAMVKNRRILHELLPAEEEMCTVHKKKLLHHGFSFKYITHIYTTQKGSTYFFCYDLGYLPFDNDCYLIVRDKKINEI